MPTYNIAIDGPAGAGKSTIAKILAGELGFVYVDTGAMYRAMALYFLRENMNAENEPEIAAACKDINIVICYQDGIQRVLLNGEDVSAQIRTEAVGTLASKVSAYAAVRGKLLELQRSLAMQSDVIMDGRDIGTCVLPEAQVKIYLTASSSVRAMRRYKELKEKGIMCNLQEIEQDIIERDHRDMSRDHAPLKQAEDAVMLDSSDLEPTEVVQRIAGIVRSAQG